MVKVVRVHETGGPEVLQIDDIELPPPGEGEVRIRNHAIGLNYIDVYFRNGQYPVAQKPFILGNEAAGEVVELAKGVKGFKRGDRVAYTVPFGCYAQERLVDAARLVKLPKAISYETAAAGLLKGLTAQYLLRHTFKVKKGHTILVHAAAGGVGLIVCQWAKALGAEVIGTVGSAEKAKLAKKAGAKHCILYREEDFVARVKELTSGDLCDVVYDGVGKATFPGSLDCLRPLGLFVSFGSASGPIEAFNLGLLAQKGSLYVTRPTLYTYIAKREDLEKNADELFRVVEKGDVEIPIHARRKLDDIVAVHREFEARKTTGATVLIP
ncbi:MAG: quinone oxidoreductase family protein [Beijerinckiaceae bacterium]